MSVRLSVNINEETAALLKREAAAQETTVTEIVRRAASVYDYVIRIHREGSRLTVTDRDGQQVELRLIL